MLFSEIMFHAILICDKENAILMKFTCLHHLASTAKIHLLRELKKLYLLKKYFEPHKVN